MLPGKTILILLSEGTYVSLLKEISQFVGLFKRSNFGSGSTYLSNDSLSFAPFFLQPWYAHGIAEAILRTANLSVPLKVIFLFLPYSGFCIYFPVLSDHENVCFQ